MHEPKYSDACFTVSPERVRMRGLALLSRSAQRRQIQCDTRQWLSEGHAIRQLPPAPTGKMSYHPMLSFPDNTVRGYDEAFYG